MAFRKGSYKGRGRSMTRPKFRGATYKPFPQNSYSGFNKPYKAFGKRKYGSKFGGHKFRKGSYQKTY
jgi:hypothetical protein